MKVACLRQNCSTTFEPLARANQRVKFCPECRKTKWRLYPSSAWDKTPEGRRYHRERYQQLKDARKSIVYKMYGNACKCCGETEINFLSIDHVNNDGAEARRNNITGIRLYRKIIDDSFPATYQLLCMNCNWGKRMTGGKCPHEQ